MNEYNEILDINGEWVVGDPTEEGQRFRKVIDFGNDKKAFVESTYIIPQVIPEKRHITKLAFKQRMTANERIAIRTASESDPIIFDFLDLVSDATYIDLDRQDTIDGVNYLESQGHLAVGRANEIITNEISNEEKA